MPRNTLLIEADECTHPVSDQRNAFFQLELGVQAQLPEGTEAPAGKLMVLRKHVKGKPHEACTTEGVVVRLVAPVTGETNFALIHGKKSRDKFTDFSMQASGGERLICKADWLCKPEIWEVADYDTDCFLGYPNPKVGIHFPHNSLLRPCFREGTWQSPGKTTLQHSPSFHLGCCVQGTC